MVAENSSTPKEVGKEPLFFTYLSEEISSKILLTEFVEILFLRASDYANIRSYIETCKIYGVNEYESLKRLVEDNPYTLAELLEFRK